MKKRSFLRVIALILTASCLACACVINGSSESDVCAHFTVKGLIQTATGYTEAYVCTMCGSAVTEIGYIDDGTSLKLYKEASRTTQYTEKELEDGFLKAAGTSLYTEDGKISSSGLPYWVCFDLKVNALPVLDAGDAEADLSNPESRAYKGWSLLCMVINGSYISPLRFIPDGWEADSGANGTSKGTSDGISAVKYFGDPYRTANTAFTLKKNDSLNIKTRIDPSNGKYDVYIDNIYAGSGKMDTNASDKNTHIRFWEYNGNNYGADIDFTGVKIFEEVYTQALHTHSYRENIFFFDNGFTKYNVCNCGEKNVIESNGFTSAVAPRVSHVYNGGEDAFSFNSDNYWFVTDINIRGEIGNGNLIRLSNTVILKASDGKIMSGSTPIANISYPTSYQAAVNVKDGSNYDLYLNGIKVASGTKSSSSSNAYRVYLGDSAFGYHVRFMYNRAVTLADSEGTASITFVENKTLKSCCHENNDTPQNKYVKEANGVVTHSYICTKCGERVYAKLTNSLVSYNNDTLFGYKSGALKKSELAAVTATGARTLYLENGLIGKNASPYMISFNVTPNTLPSLDGLNPTDPNGYAIRGYNLVSAEPSFYPTSELRVVPTETGAEIRLLKQDVNGNIINYNTHAATLAIGKKVNVTLFVTPATGEYDVYIDGEYKGSSKTAGLDDYNPKIIFHDAGAGEFVYSDITVATEAQNLSDTVNAFEFDAVYTADKTKPEGYTSLASINRTTTNGTYRFDILFVNNRTGEICFKDTQGNYQVLTSKNGDAHKLSKTATSLVAVYDDVRATVRYYVNGTVPYYGGTNAMNIAVSSDFANAAAVTDRLETNSGIVTKAQIHGMEASGVMQVIALQQKIQDDALRIVSGLDIPWYGSAGYKVTLYDASGKAMGKETKRESTSLYSEILADDVMVPATKYGYTYFVPIEIKGYTAQASYEGCYFMITPYVTIGSAVLEGEQVKITVTSSGYTFD